MSAVNSALNFQFHHNTHDGGHEVQGLSRSSDLLREKAGKPCACTEVALRELRFLGHLQVALEGTAGQCQCGKMVRSTDALPKQVLT